MLWALLRQAQLRPSLTTNNLLFDGFLWTSSFPRGRQEDIICRAHSCLPRAGCKGGVVLGDRGTYGPNMLHFQAKGGGNRKNPPEAQDAHGQTTTAGIKQDMERERKEERIVGCS